MNKQTNSSNRLHKNRGKILIGIMVLTMVLSNGYSTFQSYEQSMALHKSRLIELVHTQVNLIESIARFDALHQGGIVKGKEATLAQVSEAFQGYKASGGSEFVVAQKNGDKIEFLNFKGIDLREKDKSVLLPFNEAFAEPMRLALEGKKGWVIALDYAGEEVLAAYEPIPTLNLGLVAKMNLMEIQEPLVTHFAMVNLMALALTLIGSYFFLRIINPILLQLELDITQRKQDQRQLRLQQSSLNRAQAIAHMGNWEWDNIQNKFIFSQELYKILGVEKEFSQPTYESFLDHIHPDDRQNFIYCLDLALTENKSFGLEHRVCQSSGEVIYVCSTGEVVFDENDIPLSMTGVMRDITQEKLNQQRIALLAKVFHNTQEAVVITNHHNEIIEVNPSFEKITGYSFKDVEYKNPKIMRSGRHNKDFYKEMWATLGAEGHWEGEIWDRKMNGEVYPKYLTISKFFNESLNQINFLGVFSDITARKEAEAKLEQLAYFDSLTGLANRSHFLEQLHKDLLLASRLKHQVALLFLDLDHFKQVNDTLGHQAGDQLLIDVSKILKSSLRETDMVGRLGGDEFLIALKGVTSPEDAIQVAKGLITKLKKPFDLSGKQAHINTSIGISMFPSDTKNPGQLIKNADAAMYLSKEKGKGTYSFYTKSLDEKAQKRFFLESNLRVAIEEDQFRLLYQPQVNGESKILNGLEALIRWEHPASGTISPVDFIPVAEDTNLIIPIGNWVIEETCRQIRKWIDQGHKPVTVSVNVSQKQFTKSDLPEVIFKQLDKYQISPHLFKVEITESLLMTDTDMVSGILNELLERGIKSSIDDFGTGYSSLAYLRKFPIHELKIDQSFTRDLGEDVSIPQAIISMARSLGLKVVAEGVETMDDNKTLLELGCTTMQGYVYARPLEPKAIEAMLQEGKFFQ